MEDEVKVVKIDQIRMNPFQPRQAFHENGLSELSRSIQSVGLIHPPTVRQLEGDLYELLSGERRIRASQLAGLKEIPVYVKKCTFKESAESALIENIQRVDLNPLEVAAALKRLMKEFGFSQEELAHKVGKKRSTVANYLRLLSLPPSIQDSLRQDLITMGHAKALLSLEALDHQLHLHDKIIEGDWSVRKTEEAVHAAFKPKAPPPKNDLFLKDLEKKIAERLGTCVRLTGSSLEIDYYSLDDLDRLLTCLGIE